MPGPARSPNRPAIRFRVAAQTHQDQPRVDVAKRCGAGEVLQRLALAAAVDESLELIAVSGRDLIDQEQPRSRNPNNVGEQHAGVVLRRGDAGQR